MSERTLLFVTYGGGHAAMMAPVIEQIQRNVGPSVHCVALALTMAGPIFARRCIPYVGFKDFLRIDDVEARTYGEILARDFHSDHTGIAYEESVAYLGLSYADLVEQHGKRAAQTLFAAKGRMAFLPIATLRRIIEHIQPDVVITTNSPRAELAANIAAREQNIPTVALTDLVGIGLCPLEVDHLCIASRSAMQIYRESPIINARHYHLTGNPAMDLAARYKGPINREWRNRNYPGAITDKPWILIAEQEGYMHKSGDWLKWSNQDIIANLDLLYAACRAHEAIMLVRPHPSLRPGLYQDWVASKPPSTAYMTDRHDLHPLLNACDLLLSNISSIMLDMLHMQRPVLLLHYPDDITLLPLDTMGMTFSVALANSNALTQEIGRALDDSQALSAHITALYQEFPQPPCAHTITDIIRTIVGLS